MANNNIGGGIVKRIILMVLCCMIFSVGVCSAEIFKHKDDFSNGNIIRSNIYTDKSCEEMLRWLSFYKTKSNNSIQYNIAVSNKTLNKYGISNANGKINIDGETFDLIISNYSKMPLSGVTTHDAIYDISQNIEKKINSANRVALKITKNDGFQFVYVLPDEVLTEWKQVINTEK